MVERVTAPRSIDRPTAGRAAPPAPFVVGVPRSGTTLLRLQLDAHPDLAIPSETGFGALLADLDGDPTPEELLARIEGLSTWADLAVTRDELAAVFVSVNPWSTAEGLRAYYRWYAARNGKERWGDKTPVHVDHMPLLAATWPEAHFIHIIRDGRDVAASLRGLPFAPGDGSIEASAAAWRDGIARARRSGAALPHYLEVRYERLVTEPEATLREVCEFIELEFDPAMLNAHERAAARMREMAVVDAAAREDGGLPDSLAQVVRPPDPNRIGLWRDALGGAEVARFGSVAGGTLRALGYEPAASRESRGARRPATPSRGGLRVVIGANALAHAGGTETYVVTVARELQRLGHDPLVVAAELGPMADRAERSGVPVAHSDAELPPACDALLVNDAVAGARLAQRYADARVVHVAHSDLHDHQLPVLAGGAVDTVVVMSDRIAARIRALALDVPVVRLRHPIDTERFAPRGDIAERPRRALILSNYLHGARRRALLDAWGEAGVECVQAGAPAAMSFDVAPQIADVDIVVGKARAALEGMSCARAVYVFDEFGGDGWVTPERYPAMEADNFAGLASGTPPTAADLRRDIEDYSPDMGWQNRELVVAHHGARRHAIALLEVLRAPGDGRARPVEGLAEIARLTRANWNAERRRLALEVEVERLRAAAEAAVAQADAAVAQADAAVAQTDAAVAETDAWRERALEAERQLDEARAMLATRRAQVGLSAGRAIDKLRRRG